MDPTGSNSMAVVDTEISMSFLPDMVQKELQNNVSNIQNVLRMKPQSHQFRGICLHVEMQGFQAEIDRGLSRDSEGLSIIMNMTNSFVGSLVTKVYAWGGDVVEFSGSSMICVFLPSSDTDNKIHEKALQCAWQLKDMSQQKAPVVNMQPEDMSQPKASVVTVRIRMGYGDFAVGFLGGYDNQWRYLVTGRCINELKEQELWSPSSSSVRVASQGNCVVMSKDCHDLFQDERNERYFPNTTINGIVISAVAMHTQNSKIEWFLVRRMNIPQSAPKAPLSTSSLQFFGKQEGKRRSTSSLGKTMVEATNVHLMAQMYCFIPRPVIQALLVDSLEVTSDMVHLTGATKHRPIERNPPFLLPHLMHVCMDGVNEELLGSMDLCILQRHVYACQEIIVDVGGYISQLTIDTSGGVLVALWGNHDASIADHAQRALGAAVRIRSQLMEMNMPCSIAITSGHSYCGCLGMDRRRDYVALGDVVKLAADMAAAVKNDISIDQLTYEEIGDRLSRHFLRQSSSESSVRISHRSRQVHPFVLRMNRRHNHHDPHHHTANSAAAASVVAASAATKHHQADPVEHSDDALISSLDDVSAHDELHHMPEACQIALQQAIKQMLSHSSSSSSNGTNAKAHRAAMAAAASAAGGGPVVGDDIGDEKGKGDAIQEAKGVVVIEGEMGCGKEETVTWLKRVCCNRSLRIVAVKATVEDRADNFSTVARLFRQLVRPENFDNPVRQKLVVDTLLRETFPNDATTRVKMGYPAMHVLGVTCSLRPPANATLRQPTNPQPPIANSTNNNIAAASIGSKSKSRGSAKSRDNIGQLRPAADVASHEEPIVGIGSWINPFFMISRPDSIEVAETPDRIKSPSPGNRSRTWANAFYNRSKASSGDNKGLAGSIDASAAVGGATTGAGAVVDGGVVGDGRRRSHSNHSSGRGSVSIRTSLTTYKRLIILEEESENADKLSMDSSKTPRHSFKALILQAVAEILSHLLREQRGVVIVIEDAHEIDEQSWKVLLSMIQRKDAWTYSLIVLTHETTDSLTRATLASTKAFGLTHCGPSNAAITPINIAPPSSLPRGVRANTTASNSFHNTTFLRLSYEFTLDSLKHLKIGRSILRTDPTLRPIDSKFLEKFSITLTFLLLAFFILSSAVVASGGRYFFIASPSALLVRHQLALALETAVDRVEPSLEAVVMRFCKSSPFWLREILAFIVLYGLEEFLADMTGNRRRREDEGQTMAIVNMTSLTSIKARPRMLSSKRGIIAADMKTLRPPPPNLLPQSNNSPATNSHYKLPTSTRFASYLPALMHRLSLGTISPVIMPSSTKKEGKSPEIEARAGVTTRGENVGGAGGGGGTHKASTAMAALNKEDLPNSDGTGTPVNGMNRRATSFHATKGNEMNRRATSFHGTAVTAVPFQGNSPAAAANSPNGFDLALANRNQPSIRQPSGRSLLFNNTAIPDPGVPTVADNTSIRMRASFANLQMIPRHSIRGLGTQISAMSAHFVNGVTQGAMAMSDHSGFTGGNSVGGGGRGLGAVARSARNAVESLCESIHESYGESNKNKMNADLELKRDDGDDGRGSDSHKEAMSEKSDDSGSLSSSVHNVFGPHEETASSLAVLLKDHKRDSTLFDSSKRLHLLRDNSIRGINPMPADIENPNPGLENPNPGLEKVSARRGSAFNSHHESCKLLRRKMSMETSNALKWGHTTLVASRLNRLAMDEQIVIRIAAVVGYSFRLDVLEQATPTPMRPYLSTILSSLVDCYWLTTNTVRIASSVITTYAFCHISVQQILYEMTPENFRGSTHLTFAESASKPIRPRDQAAITVSASGSSPPSRRVTLNASALLPESVKTGYLKSLMRNSLGGMGSTQRKGDRSSRLIQETSEHRPAACIDEVEDVGMMPQHRLLFAAYHYSLSGMPPSKTVEFLCKACDKVLHYNTHTPLSKVQIEMAVRLICWASQLAKLVTEVVVLLALVHKSKHYVMELWREEDDEQENSLPTTLAKQSTSRHPNHPARPSTAPLISPSAESTTEMMPLLSWSWLCSGKNGGLCGGGGVVAPSRSKPSSLVASNDLLQKSGKHRSGKQQLSPRSGNRSSSLKSDKIQSSSSKSRKRISSVNQSIRSILSVHSLTNLLKTVDGNKNNNTSPVAASLSIHQVLSTALAAVERSLEAQLILLYKERDRVPFRYRQNTLNSGPSPGSGRISARRMLSWDSAKVKNESPSHQSADAGKGSDSQGQGAHGLSVNKRKSSISGLFSKAKAMSVQPLKPSTVGVLPSAPERLPSRQGLGPGRPTIAGQQSITNNITLGTGGLLHALSMEKGGGAAAADRDPALLGLVGANIDTSSQHWKTHYHWFYLDMEEAEPWQRALIEYRHSLILLEPAKKK